MSNLTVAALCVALIAYTAGCLFLGAALAQSGRLI